MNSTLSSTLASIGSAVANHLWQSTVFAVAAWLLTLALRRNQARVRHAVWLAASLKFLLPFSLLIAAGNLLPHPRQAVAPVMYSAMDVVEEPFAQIIFPAAPPAVHVPTLRERIESALPMSLSILWLLGACVVLFVWTIRLRAVRRTLRKAAFTTEGREFEILQRLEAGFAVERRHTPLQLRLSVERMEPGIFGIFRPVLLWPRELSARLDDEHIEAILAHELVHVRRRDNLTAALHMLVETAFWFHPLVWWMERQMVKEREQACDEAVIAMGSDVEADAAICNQTYAETYAEALLKTCRFCIESPLACVAGVTGADLKQRVVEIVTGRALLHMSWAKKLLLATAAVCVVAAPVVLGQAKAAQRLMLAAINAAPKPVQAAAHAMMAEEVSPASSDAADASQSTPPATDASSPAADDMRLGPEFEVATIRPYIPDASRNWVGIKLAPAGRVTGSQMTLTSLVRFAYAGFNPNSAQVSGGPKWAESGKWDLSAKVDDATVAAWASASDRQRMQTIRPMLRTLLVKRFQLKLHAETKVVAAYALVQAKGGAKLKEVPPPPTNADPQEEEQRERRRKIADGASPGGFMMGGNKWVGNALQIGLLTGEIGANARLDAPLVDETGLHGYYSFTFNSAEDADAPPLLDQIEQQLGLKVIEKKEPITTYVIDSAEKPSVDGAEVTPAGVVQTPVKVPLLDVISVKPNKCGNYCGSSMGALDGASGTNVSVHQMLTYSYHLNDNQVANEPDWAKSERFDIKSKVSAADEEAARKLTQDQARVYFEQVLKERFGLVAHHETKELPEYALALAKGGMKLADHADANAPQGLKHGGFRTSMSGGVKKAECVDMPIDLLLQFLSNETGRTVVDQAALTGKYTFTLSWRPAMVQAPADDAAESTPDLFTAIQEQLGLKLEPIKGPMDVLVIDHIEMPSEN